LRRAQALGAAVSYRSSCPRPQRRMSSLSVPIPPDLDSARGCPHVYLRLRARQAIAAAA
jgi:hypothetical protein